MSINRGVEICTEKCEPDKLFIGIYVGCRSLTSTWFFSIRPYLAFFYLYIMLLSGITTLETQNKKKIYPESLEKMESE